MKVEIDQDQLKGIVSEAILVSMDQSKRDNLIKAALHYLLEPDRSSGYGTKSPIERAFESGVNAAAFRIVNEQLSSDTEIQTAIKNMIVEAVERFISTNREETVQKMADAIAAGLVSRR